jgi:Pentapeptide repeats (8 copies)
VWRFLRRLAPVTLVVVVLILGWAFIFEVPNHLVPRDLVPSGVERVKARHDDRATLLQSLVGVLVLLGAYLTWQQVRVSREGQITDRFTRAIEQLGSNKVDVRLGGIYALERIAKDSPADRDVIIEVLSAYIREHGTWREPTTSGVLVSASAWDLPPLRARAADVQAAIIVLGRTPRSGDAELWLSDVDLRRARLENACLNGARLSRAHLEASALNGAQLQDAALWAVHFEEAILENANLVNAQLNSATLNKAHLRGARLEGADLRGASFSEADLTAVSFKGARANSKTIWPEGFDPTAAGVLILND